MRQGGQESLVPTKFDLLEAFKGHADLVKFLQEQVCCRRRVTEVKQALLETSSIAQADKARALRQKQLQELREKKAMLRDMLSDCNQKVTALKGELHEKRNH